MWEAVSDAVPDRVVLVQGDAAGDVAPVRRPRRAPGRGARRRGAPTGLEGRVVPLQQQRVQRRRVRDAQAARRAGERQLPLPRGRARVPASTTPTPRRCCSTASSATGSPRSAAQAPNVKCWIQVDDGAPLQEFAVAYEELLARARSDAAHRALRRRPLLPLHRRHHRHAEGRDVAQRGPRSRSSPTARTRSSGAAPPERPEDAGAIAKADRRRRRRSHAPARRRRSCTAPVASRSFQAMFVGSGIVTLGEPPLRRARAVADGAARARDPDGDRRRRVRQADGARARGGRGRRRRPTTSRRCS